MGVVEMAARVLRPNEREAVLGDLTESGEDSWTGLGSVLGLILWRELELWRSWKPWAAGGVALAGSLLLLGVSYGLSVASLLLPHRGWMQAQLATEVTLMVAWAWSGGFLAGTLSRRTLWMSVALCAVPCLSCVLRFQEASLSRFCVLLFLAPAIVGAVQGFRGVRVGSATAIVLAAGVTALMLTWRGMSVWNWLLLLPSWSLVALAEESRGRKWKVRA